MYINFNLLLKQNFPIDNPLLILQIIHQKEYEFLKNVSKELLIKLFNEEYITKIKPSKKDTPKYLLARLTDKGKKFLKDLSIAKITDESVNLSSKLVSLYKDNGLEIKNVKKIVELISWFLSETDFTPEHIYTVAEDYVQTNNKKFTMNLNNFIWRPESVFQKKWNLSQSKLYSLCQK